MVHAKGFNNTGIQEILDAAGVPKGSFYFYFKSKEDFGLHLIDYFGETLVSNAMEILQNTSIPPMERLDSAMERNQQRFERIQFKYGCPIGNMMQEMADISNAFRERTTLMYARVCSCYESCLREGQQAGDISP